jgi:hypothetical protein
MLLDNLGAVINSLRDVSLKHFGAISLETTVGTLRDIECTGLDLGWLVAHVERRYAARKALKIPKRIEAKRKEVEAAQVQVDLVRTALQQREATLAERQTELAELERQQELSAGGAPPVTSTEPVTLGLFPEEAP